MSNPNVCIYRDDDDVMTTAAAISACLSYSSISLARFSSPVVCVVYAVNEACHVVMPGVPHLERRGDAGGSPHTHKRGDVLSPDSCRRSCLL